MIETDILEVVFQHEESAHLFLITPTNLLYLVIKVTIYFHYTKFFRDIYFYALTFIY